MYLFRYFVGHKRDVATLVDNEADAAISEQSLYDVITTSNESPFHRLKSAIPRPKTTISNEKLLLTFGRKGRNKSHLSRPGGVTITSEGDVIVADTDNCRLQVFNQSGELKQVIGEKGHEPHQLNQPSDVTLLSREGEECILVSDSVNSCLKIFNRAGSCLDVYRCRPGLLEYPCGVCVSQDNTIVVTDLINHKVIILNADGGELGHFGRYGDGPREFDHPYYVTVDKKNRIVVSDYGNMAVKIFSMSGELFYCFGVNDFHIFGEDFVQVQGITTDDEGNVLIVGNSTAYIVANNGRFWEIIPPCPGLGNLRAIACSSGIVVLTRDTEYKDDQVLVFDYQTDNFRSLRHVQEPRNKKDVKVKYKQTKHRAEPISVLRTETWDSNQHSSNRSRYDIDSKEREYSGKKCVKFEENEKASPESEANKTHSPVQTQNNGVRSPSATHKPKHKNKSCDFIIGRQMPTLDYDLIERKRRMKAKSQATMSPAHIFNFS